jgi:hypothetical protein
MLNVFVILQIPEPNRQLYAKLGQPIEGGQAGLVMLSGDAVDYLSSYVRVLLSAPPSMKGVWVSVPHSYVIVIVSGAEPREMGFRND